MLLLNKNSISAHYANTSPRQVSRAGGFNSRICHPSTPNVAICHKTDICSYNIYCFCFNLLPYFVLAC